MDLSVSSTMFGFEDPKVISFFLLFHLAHNSLARLSLVPLTKLFPTQPSQLEAFVHRLVRRDDAAFLQHAHLQVEHRVVP